MKYLLDTDILSNLVLPAPSPALLRRIASTPDADQATSSITVGELYYGARRLPEGGKRLIERIDAARAGATVLSFDERAAKVYGDLRAELERVGRPIGVGDTRIAAIALAHDLTVVTANTRHFERVPGLTVENWLE